MKTQKTILIVDDVTDNIDILEGVLSPQYQIRVAKNGEQTLESVSKNPPDLILMDVTMPVMDGYETCKHLKASPSTKDIPVIFLTAKNRVQDIIRGFEIGAVDYVTKPFNVVELLARVNTHLQLREALEAIQITQEQLSEHNQQMQEDLHVAALFQQQLLPGIPQIPFLNIACQYIPYDEVSGDTYSIPISNNDAFDIFLGDAAGHGISAAFMTMIIQAEFDNITPDLKPDEILRNLNAFLCARQREKWITGVYLRIWENGFLETAKAGHPPLIIVPSDGKSSRLFKNGGCPLGVFPEEPLSYVTEDYQLQNDDLVFVYTDGLTEWRNPDGKMFGIARLVGFLEEQRAANPENLLNLLYEHLEHFAAGTPCEDDLTMFGFRYQQP